MVEPQGRERVLIFLRERKAKYIHPKNNFGLGIMSIGGNFEREEIRVKRGGTKTNGGVKSLEKKELIKLGKESLLLLGGR